MATRRFASSRSTPTSGAARAVVSEEPKTFYNSWRKFSHDVGNAGREILWMSERDGWNHLYLYDGATGKVKNQITRGDWVVRGVTKVDEAKRQVWFSASGMYPGKDPYLVHFYRIDFDGSNLVTLTEADANHDLRFSSDMAYYVDTYSRVDLPTVSELRRTSDRSLVATLEKPDVSALLAAGFKYPEVFTAKAPGRQDGHLGRDRQADELRSRRRSIRWSRTSTPVRTARSCRRRSGRSARIRPATRSSACRRSPRWASSSCRSTAWAPATGPRPSTTSRGRTSATPAFRIASCGTRRRRRSIRTTTSRASASTAARPAARTRVGGLLFHPDFYKVAVSFNGCHDNRMDKIGWNEQWMGYPLDERYGKSSNVDNAGKLQGQVLLIVGELDMNVDPASTMQVVNGLIKANKMFDLLVIPGGGHGAGRTNGPVEYGTRRSYDFFVRHLQGVATPDWNRVLKTAPTSSAQ